MFNYLPWSLLYFVCRRSCTRLRWTIRHSHSVTHSVRTESTNALWTWEMKSHPTTRHGSSPSSMLWRTSTLHYGMEGLPPLQFSALRTSARRFTSSCCVTRISLYPLTFPGRLTLGLTLLCRLSISRSTTGTSPSHHRNMSTCTAGVWPTTSAVMVKSIYLYPIRYHLWLSPDCTPSMKFSTIP